MTSARAWWSEGRPEIVEDFDREVYGRMPKDLPGVSWQVASGRSWPEAASANSAS